ncbi:hypothetical protein CRG98_029712 [Punica granatum]|uniref:Uncharacterized protein n=1 Tax=Punica granatum TaxID=22663 RepID=A0A2I0J1V6_PUNGR|nr:hypothetical protein CRG98_029712 [Punica granatum]
MNGLMLAKKIMRLGYYWSTMETDYEKHVENLFEAAYAKVRGPEGCGLTRTRGTAAKGKIRNPKGRSPLTDSRLPHAANRDLGAPKIVRECPTPPRSTLVTFGSIPVIRVHPDHLGPSRSLRSTLVTFGSIPVIQDPFGQNSGHSDPSGLNPGHSGSLRSKFRSFGSFRSKSRSPRVHSGLSRSFRSILIHAFGSIPVIQVYPGSCIRVYPDHSGLSSFMHSGLSRSFRSIPVHAFGSILVIQVYPDSCIRVHPGHSGLSWFMHSGLSRSFRSILVHAFGSIPIIQIYPGSCIRVYPGHSGLS